MGQDKGAGIRSLPRK